MERRNFLKYFGMGAIAATAPVIAVAAVTATAFMGSRKEIKGNTFAISYGDKNPPPSTDSLNLGIGIPHNPEGWMHAREFREIAPGEYTLIWKS